MFPRQTRLSIGLTGVRLEWDEFAAVCHLDDVAKQLLTGQTKRLDIRSQPTLRNKQYLECAGLASKQNDLALLGNKLLAAHRDSLRPSVDRGFNLHYRMDQFGNAPVQKQARKCQLVQALDRLPFRLG
jgi:hypothetical protein